MAPPALATPPDVVAIAPAIPPSKPEMAKVRMPAARLPGSASRVRQPRSSPISSPMPRASATRQSKSGICHVSAIGCGSIDIRRRSKTVGVMTAWRLAPSSGDASQSRRAHLGALELIKRAFIQWFVWGLPTTRSIAGSRRSTSGSIARTSAQPKRGTGALTYRKKRVCRQPRFSAPTWCVSKGLPGGSAKLLEK